MGYILGIGLMMTCPTSMASFTNTWTRSAPMPPNSPVSVSKVKNNGFSCQTLGTNRYRLIMFQRCHRNRSRYDNIINIELAYNLIDCLVWPEESSQLTKKPATSDQVIFWKYERCAEFRRNFGAPDRAQYSEFYRSPIPWFLQYVPAAQWPDYPLASQHPL